MCIYGVLWCEGFSRTYCTAAVEYRTKDIVRCHLHLYDGILDVIPSLHDKLDMSSSDRLSKIIFAVSTTSICVRLSTMHIFDSIYALFARIYALFMEI